MSTTPVSPPAPAPEHEDSGSFWDSWVKDMARQQVELEEELATAEAGSSIEAAVHEDSGEGQDEAEAEETFAGEPDSEDGEDAEPVFDDLESWVNFYFLPMFRRVEGGENKWCRTWWKHAEAIARLDALWRAWESLRLDDQTGMSTWFRDHADHHIPLLMSQNGPFRQCKGETHRETAELESDWAPDGWWDGEDEDE